MDKGLKFFELLRLSLRTFRVKPQRVILTVSGMSVGIATVLVLVSLGYGLQYILIGRLITTEDSIISMEISYPSESNMVISAENVGQLLTHPNIAEVSPVAEFPGEFYTEGSSRILVDTKIVEPSYFKLSGALPDIGEIFEEEKKGTIVSNQTLLAQGLEVSDISLGKFFNLDIFYEDGTGGILTPEQIASINQPLPLSGIIIDDAMVPTVVVPVSSVTNPPPFYTKAFVKADNVDYLEAVRDDLINQGFLVSARVDLVDQARKITNIITIILLVFGITALVVSAIGMFNTMLVAFMERIYEVGILKSIGATDANIRNLFLLESIIMGVAGGAGGIIVGYGFGQLLNLIISTVASRFGGNAIKLFITPGWFILLILAFSGFIGILSGWVPARKASRLSPKEAFTNK